MPIKEVEVGVERVEDEKGLLLALVVRSSYNKEGVNFFTQSDFPFQFGYIKQPAGYESKPHTHTLLPDNNVIRNVQEVVFVVEGGVEFDFYGGGKEVLETVRLLLGDAILFVSGGHGYRVEKDCKAITVKQGPYPGEERAKEYIR